MGHGSRHPGAARLGVALKRMTKILLTRHGHVEGIKPERFRGREPLALTERGRAEAQALASRIARAWRPSAIYTSPMGRCVATGAAIAQACGIAAAICDDLNDIDYGAWQFKTFDEAKNEDPKLFAAWFATPHLVRFPRGEALQDVVARAGNVLRLVVDRHCNDTVVLVGHDSVNRALLLELLDQPLSAYWRLAQDPCCLNEIDIDAGTVSVRRINETLYLEG
jgi:broad specificity phosphatase PhoE